MAVDNAPATNALNLLNGIDYGAVIGAPLQAAITAQAMAAKSTWEFIQEVGLQTDANGNKSAVNVTFTYQRGGELVKLIVPILTIVPIPAIVVTDIEIAFKANINASASQASEQSESTDIGGELSGGAKVGWGPFSIDANFKANYSSKKDSKATQNSQYSVEYTQDVTVKAAQAGIPAGLATVLNILSSAATGASLDGDLMVSPSLITLDVNNPQDTRLFSITVVDSNGLNVKGADVTISLPDSISPTFSLMNMGVAAHRLSVRGIADAVKIGLAPLGKQLEWNNNKVQVKTGDNGKIDLIVGLNPKQLNNLPPDGIFELTISTKINEKDRDFLLPVKVIMPLSVSQQLIPSVDGNLVLQDTNPKNITVQLLSNSQPISGAKITASTANPRPDQNTKLKINDTSGRGEATTNSDGKAAFKLQWDGDPGSGNWKIDVIFLAQGDQQSPPVKATVNVSNQGEDKSILRQLPPSKIELLVDVKDQGKVIQGNPPQSSSDTGEEVE